MENKRASFTSSLEESSIANGRRTCDNNIDNEILTCPKNVKFDDCNCMHKVKISKLSVQKDISSDVKVEIVGQKESLDSKVVSGYQHDFTLAQKITEKLASQFPHNGKMDRALTGQNLSSCSNNVAAVQKKSLLKPMRQGFPELETAQRVRPTRVNSSIEIKAGMISKIPKLVSNAAHRKLLVKSEPQFPLQQGTKPQPFNLATEDRGIEKGRKFISQLKENERKERKARIPKANPLPYSTDSPVIPPKPQPKECTKPEPFKLESVIRHEEELQRIMEDRERFLREEAEMKNFRARPIMTNFTKNIYKKVRMPLTEVQEFNLCVDDRAIQRAEFDRRIKEKEKLYMRLKAESEAVMKAQEEQAIKNMRKAMVPHVRPVPDFSKPFVPQRASKEPTRPKSPKFHGFHKGNRNQKQMYRNMYPCNDPYFQG